MSDNIFQRLLSFRRRGEQDTVNAQNFQIAALTNGYRNPKWVCRYAIGDVSYPDIFNARLEVFGQTDGASAGTAHTHTLDVTNQSWAEAAVWSMSPAESYGGSITISNSATLDSLAFVGGKATGTLNNVFLDLYRMTAAGGAVRLDSVNVAASFTTSPVYTECNLTAPVVVNAGEQYLIVLRNSSTVATDVSIAGVSNTGGQQDIGAYWGGADVGKSSYTATEIATAYGNTDIQPWVQFAAKSVTATPRSFSDDFNRATLGGLWSLKSSGSDNLTILLNRLCYTNLATGNQNGIATLPTDDDAAKVEANLYINPFAVSGQRLGLLMHCNREFSQVVYLAIGGGAAKIYSGSTASLTQRATISFSGGDGLYALYYDQPNDKYVALKDGQPIGLEWTSVGATVTHGSDYCYGGVRIECASSTLAGGIDNFTLRDFMPV